MSEELKDTIQKAAKEQRDAKKKAIKGAEDTAPVGNDFKFENQDFRKMKTKLDDVGCGFCLAKWTQVTIQMQTGHNHSCHHPGTHKVSEAEVKRNPTALHNTRFKKKRRKEMLENKRPKECGYCWNVEDNSPHFSDRIFKSNESWSKPHFDEIKKSDWRGDFNPRYVEVSFSHTCNFKCSYCGPAYSTTWQQEIEKYGGYPTTDDFNGIKQHLFEDKWPAKQTEHNPYVEAFWKWWPDLYYDLHTFRITGGEPLLSKDTWKTLDYIIDQPKPNRKLQLAINSNLGVPDELIDKFCDKVNRICDERRVKEFIIFTSIDGWGQQAEYARHGLVFNRFWNNMNTILSRCPRVNITIMSTYNALSVPSYHKLLDGVYQLKHEYGSSDRFWESAVFLDTSYLRHPTHQTVQILPKDWSEKILDQARLMFYYGIPSFGYDYVGYSDIEIQKIKRLHDWMGGDFKGPYGQKIDKSDVNKTRMNFVNFMKAHDKRRGTDFLKVFPEFEELWHKWETISFDNKMQKYLMKR